MIRVVILAVVAVIGAMAARAQEMSSSLAARLADSPQSVLAQAEELILGHGRDGAINRDGIVNMVMIDRAAARARTLGQLLAADLDGDGSVGASEAATAAAARSATSRGRLLRLVSAADADGDGQLTQPEIRTAAEVQARRAVSDTREARMLDLLAMDADGDGRLTLAEVRAATAAAQAAPAAAAADQGA